VSLVCPGWVWMYPLPAAIDVATRAVQFEDAAGGRAVFVESATGCRCIEPDADLRALCGIGGEVLSEQAHGRIGEIGQPVQVFGEAGIVGEVRVEPQRDVIRRRALFAATGAAAFAGGDDGEHERFTLLSWSAQSSWFHHARRQRSPAQPVEHQVCKTWESELGLQIVGVR
jgi:hypothetical protein